MAASPTAPAKPRASGAPKPHSSGPSKTSSAAGAKGRGRPAKQSAAKPRAGAARPASARSNRNAKALRQPPQPRGIPSQPRAPVPAHRPEILGTAVQAAAELAEIGLALSARAVRRAVSRIPRP